MKKKNEKRNILDDKRVLLVLSLVLAFLCWMIVAGFIYNTDSYTIPNVAIDYERTANEYEKSNLIITNDMQNLHSAVVKVEGDSSLISGLNNSDVTVYAEFRGITGPGTYQVPIVADRVTIGSYKISDFSLYNSEYSLSKSLRFVSLTFEEKVTKTFFITVKAEGVTAASGYFRDEPTVSQASVTVTGPSSEIAAIQSVVARVDVEEEREETLKYGATLEMLDAEGKAIQSSNLVISPIDTVEVTIPILEMRTLQLTVDIIGTQQGFDTEWLMNRLSLSSTSIQVVGASGVLTNLENPYPVTEIDISALDTGWVSNEMDIQLPDGVRSQDPAKQFTVSFDSTDLVKKTFDVTNISVRNSPANAVIKPVVESVSVTLIGSEDQINALLPENITVEVDAFNVSAKSSGQQTIPSRVVIPSAGQVFATGSYPIICNIEVN